MVKGLLGAQQQCVDNAKRTVGRQSGERGRSKIWDLFMLKNENKSILILTVLLAYIIVVTRWSGLRALRAHASADEQLSTKSPPAPVSVPARSLVDLLLHKDGRRFLSETGLLHLVGGVSCSGVTPTNHGNHFLCFLMWRGYTSEGEALLKKSSVLKRLR
ncbi:hypothetical protein NDU88_005788 [Pleurodeles waltl]|uniref:Uncharacterized protein n=1 Tax=Pleurodeles waltl TaxID=8319 RepID=A0AAV7SMV9_PLEWA|nr:hypothetical protein NDU88_005788 [Pleurodeles waltl]